MESRVFVREENTRIGQDPPITVRTLLNELDLTIPQVSNAMPHRNSQSKNIILNEFEIFEAAIKITNQAERAAFLREACQGDQEMHIRIEVAIRSDIDADQLLEPSGTD